MIKTIISISIVFLFCTKITAQSVSEIIDRVMKAQSSIGNVSYNMVRHDTLVTGHVRTIIGSVKMRTDTSDQIFGFQFWAKENAVNGQMVYNGNMAYETDDDQQVYNIATNPANMKDLLYHPGGRVVMPDLVKLDTSGVRSLHVSVDERFYYLMVFYPDLTEYDVTKRYKKLTIDKLKMLPIAVSQHQETLGKVQDLAWTIQELHINEQSLDYDFAAPPFLKTHSQKIPDLTAKHPQMGLKGKPAPLFELKSFEDKVVSLSDLTGKVVLLDFWEVWCGPCVASMPKVQQLYDKFKDKGLIVYGITSEIKQLESSKRFMHGKPEIKFPMLIGNEALKKGYLLSAVPQYVLIGRDGRIRFLSLGYADQIEAEIERALNAN